MRTIEPPDLDTSIHPENIARILAYLNRLDSIPLDAIEALRSLAAEVDRLRSALPVDVALGNEGKVLTSWRCEVCGKYHTRVQTAGFAPKYCQPDDPQDGPTPCQVEAKRRQDAETNRERQQRWRDRRRQQKVSQKGETERTN